MMDIAEIHMGGAWNTHNPNRSVQHEIYTIQRLIHQQSQDKEHVPEDIKRKYETPPIFFQCSSTC